jgi:hypothetical protein
METLRHMECVVCREDAPTMMDAEVIESLRRIAGWDIVELDPIKRLRRVCAVDDFAQALEFMGAQPRTIQAQHGFGSEAQPARMHDRWSGDRSRLRCLTRG